MPHLPIASSPDVPPPAPPFFQRPLVQQLVPLLTSFTFHLAIIIIASLLIIALPRVRVRPPVEQVIIPDTNLVEGANAGGVPNPGINDDPTRGARQNDSRIASENDWATKKSDTLVANLTQGAADTKQNVTPIGVGQQSSASVTGLTQRGQSTGGGLAPFGPPGGGGGSGKGLFGIPGGNVKKVVYVCDISGSMMGLRRTLLDIELKRAVDSLNVTQAFNIILFRDAGDERGEPYVAMSSTSLMLATAKNKGYAADFIGRYDLRGMSDPIPAFKAAFPMKPELIFLLTDGELLEPEKVIQTLAELNVSKKVKINTILLLSTDADQASRERSIAEEGEQTMKQIAQMHGGTFKLVRPADLQRE